MSTSHRAIALRLQGSVLLLGLVAGASGAGAQTWSPPVTVASSAQPERAPAVAANGSGIASATWAAGGRIQARLRVRGAWSSIATLSPAGVVAAGPATSVGPGGDVVVAWSEGAAGAQGLRAVFFSGGRWGTPFAVTPPVTRISSVRAEFNGRNEAILAWSQGETDGSCAVWSSAGRPATGWAAPTKISGATGCWSWVSLSASANGEAIATFSNVRPVRGGNDIWISTRHAVTGLWAAPQLIAGATYRSGEPSVALAENGLAIVTWADAYGPLWSRRAPDGTWSMPATVDDGTGALFTGTNDVAMDAAGNAVVALGTFDDTYTYQPLRAAMLGAGSNRFTPATLLTSLTSTITSFQIACSPAGTFVVGWMDAELDPVSWRPVGAGVSTLAPGSGWRRQAFRSGDDAIAAAAATGTGIVLWNAAATRPSTTRASSASIR